MNKSWKKLFLLKSLREPKTIEYPNNVNFWVVIRMEYLKFSTKQLENAFSIARLNETIYTIWLCKYLESQVLDICVGTNINFINSKASRHFFKRIALINDTISAKSVKYERQ